MEADVGLAAMVAPYLDLPPSDIADAGAEGLGDSFLHSPAGCQGLGAASAVFTLSLSEDTFQEAIAMPAHSLLNSPNFNQVNAYYQHVVTE